ncbi:MAG: hypothetical protein JWR01_2919 [Subtercola sp.]|nr:hypothetical protein [Subtercola sp.]
MSGKEALDSLPCDPPPPEGPSVDFVRLTPLTLAAALANLGH